MLKKVVIEYDRTDVKKLISFEPDETSYNLPTRKTNQGKFPLH
jgi:DNA-directed RNA polymerase subunit beta